MERIIIPQIMALKAELAASDYKAIKFAEGELSAEEYAPIREQRRMWRNKINELEEQLAYNVKASEFIE